MDFYNPVPDDEAAEPQPLHRSRGRLGRRVAAGTAAALVIGGGGVGLGLALAPNAAPSGSGTSPNATSVLNGNGTSGNDTTQGSDGQGSYGQGGYGQGTYGDGTWYGGGTWSQQGGAGQGTTGDGTTGQGTPGQGETASQAATSSELTGLVRIDSTLGYDNGEAAGTGMVVTSDGEVITNHHVVAGATSLKVTVMSTGKSYTAKVVGTDATDDVAVIQLQDASGLSTVKTDTSAVSVGDKVTAVGDANGTTDQLSAAAGKVSAVNQQITTESDGTAAGEKLTGLIQITADVISGDSGGATYDGSGEVVGMTTAASSGGNEVDGYAIPIAKVLDIAGDLESGVTNASYAYGYPAFLGIGLADNGGTTVQGAYDGTAAARAGITAGDSITKVGSTSVSTADALSKAIASHSPGDHVSVTWTDTSGASHTATVTLGTGPVA